MRSRISKSCQLTSLIIERSVKSAIDSNGALIGVEMAWNRNFSEGSYNSKPYTFLEVITYGKECFVDRPSDYMNSTFHQYLNKHESSIRSNIAALDPFFRHEKLKTVSTEQETQGEPWWNNGYFSAGDARATYAVAVLQNPSSWIEIGSCNSTKFLRKAIVDFDLQTKITCIDPNPRAEIDQVADEIVRRSLGHVLQDDGWLDRICGADVIFLDGGHILFPGTDLEYLLVDILPRVKSGTLIHVHDIKLPYDYSEEFIFRGYNEQTALAAVLVNSERYVPYLPVHYANTRGWLGSGGTSFWLETR